MSYLRVEFVSVLRDFVLVGGHLCLRWLFLQCVLCVSVCVLGSDCVGLCVVWLMQGVVGAMSCDVQIVCNVRVCRGMYSSVICVFFRVSR